MLFYKGEIKMNDQLTQEELEAKQKADERLAAKWLRRHSADFDPTPENVKQIRDYIEIHHLTDFESNLEANLEMAFVVLTKQGQKFTTASGPVVMAPPAEAPLPEVPAYMAHVKVKKDISQIPRATYKEWFYGKHGHLFRVRVNEILRRGK